MKRVLLAFIILNSTVIANAAVKLPGVPCDKIAVKEALMADLVGVIRGVTQGDILSGKVEVNETREITNVNLVETKNIDKNAVRRVFSVNIFNPEYSAYQVWMVKVKATTTENRRMVQCKVEDITAEEEESQ